VSPQEQKTGLSQSKGDASKASASLLRGSGSVGADSLLQLLKNYCRSLDIKTVGLFSFLMAFLIVGKKHCAVLGTFSQWR
jgi:hypothetical protein